MTKNGLGDRLAEGACAEVYVWGDDGKRIVKVAKPNTNLFALERELRHCLVAWRLGLPVPRPYDLVQTGGRNGIVLERVAGDTILQRFAAYALATTPEQYRHDPDADCLHAKTTARLLHHIHSHSPSEMPAQHASLERDIRRAIHLTDPQKDAVMALLDHLPKKRQLCHGDPNPGNILLNGQGAIVVDWNNATLGNPQADLAEYVLMLRYAMLPRETPWEVRQLFDAARERSIRLFVAEYEQLSGIGWPGIEPWLGPIAARKLAVDGISKTEKDQLVAEVLQRLPMKSQA